VQDLLKVADVLFLLAEGCILQVQVLGGLLQFEQNSFFHCPHRVASSAFFNECCLPKMFAILLNVHHLLDTFFKVILHSLHLAPKDDLHTVPLLSFLL